MVKKLRYDKKTSENEGVYFRPNFRINYNSKKSFFSVYDCESKESYQVETLSLYQFRTLYVHESTQKSPFKFTSNYVENAFGDIITIYEKIADPSGKLRFNKRAKIKWNGHIRAFEEEGTGKNLWLNGSTNTIKVGMFDTGESFVLSMPISVAYNLRVYDKDNSNVEDVENFKAAECIELYPHKKPSKVGKPGSQSDVYFLHCKALEKSIPTDLIATAEKINQELQAHLDWAQGVEPIKISEPAQTNISDLLEEEEEDEIPF